MIEFDPAAISLCERIALERKRHGRFQIRTSDFLAEAGGTAGLAAIGSALDLGWVIDCGHFLQLTAAGIYVANRPPVAGRKDAVAGTQAPTAKASSTGSLRREAATPGPRGAKNEDRPEPATENR